MFFTSTTLTPISASISARSCRPVSAHHSPVSRDARRSLSTNVSPSNHPTRLLLFSLTSRPSFPKALSRPPEPAIAFQCARCTLSARAFNAVATAAKHRANASSAAVADN